MLKNPTLIALLNFVFIGLGTFLYGKRPLYGLLLTAGGGFLRFEEMRIAPAFTGHFNIHWLVATTGLALLGVGTALDGWREAKGVRLSSGL